MTKFDKFCNQILQEQYTITAREVLYRRYGKDVADSMIAKIKARGKDPYLEKKYALPDYSNKNLDRVVDVIFTDFGEEESYGGENTVTPAKTIKAYAADGGPFAPPDENRILFNRKQMNLNYPSKRELEGGPAQVTHPEKNEPLDTLGHEVTHTLQKGSTYNMSNLLQTEFAPVLGEMKRWYYKNTGILLDADATDAQINAFIDYCNKRNIFDNVGYGKKIDFEKLLRTSEGKEVFRRIVKQTPMKTDTMVA